MIKKAIPSLLNLYSPETIIAERKSIADELEQLEKDLEWVYGKETEDRKMIVVHRNRLIELAKELKQCPK